MKNRPWLFMPLTAALLAGALFQSLGGLDGIRAKPGASLIVAAVLILIAIPIVWLRYRRLKQEPVFVEVQNREASALTELRSIDGPLVLIASRTKKLGVLVGPVVTFALLGALMWKQPGVCRAAGIVGVAPLILMLLAAGLADVLRPVRLEISAQGLRHTTFWRSRLWPWGEIRDVTIINRKAVGPLLPSTVLFRRYSAQASASGPSRVKLDDVFPMASDDLASLLNNARLRWAPQETSAFTPVKAGLVGHLRSALVALALGVVFWLLIGRPCGP